MISPFEERRDCRDLYDFWMSHKVMPRIKHKWIAFVKMNGKRPEAGIVRPHKMPFI